MLHWRTKVSTGNDANTNFPNSAGSPGTNNSLSDNCNIVIDTIQPLIQSMTAPSNGTYGIGAVIPIAVNFSEIVDLSGITSSIKLLLNSDGWASLASPTGNGTATLNFEYTVQEGENSANLSHPSSAPSVSE